MFVKGLINLTFGPIFWLLSKSSKQGAQTQLYCALEDFDKIQGGKYYSDCRVQQKKLPKTFEKDQEKLWDISEEFVKEFS